MSANKVKYALIGDPEKQEVIGEYFDEKNKAISKEAETIFKRFCQSEPKQYDCRIDLESENCKGAVFYFILPKFNSFYLVLFEKKAKVQKLAFDLIDEIIGDKINLMVDESTNKLNSQGRKNLKNIITQYQTDKLNKTNFDQINESLDNIKGKLKDNIGKVANNMDSLEDTAIKAEKLKGESQKYYKNSEKLKWCAKMQKWKWFAILILIIVVLIVIFVPVGIHLGKKDKSSSKNSNSSNNNTSNTSNTDANSKKFLI